MEAAAEREEGRGGGLKVGGRRERGEENSSKWPRLGGEGRREGDQFKEICFFSSKPRSAYVARNPSEFVPTSFFLTQPIALMLFKEEGKD